MSPDDGTRVLVMRKWPRGVRRERVDLWLRELGPEEPLMREFLDGRVPWSRYRLRYLAGLVSPRARPALAEVRALIERGPVTLLCWCADAERCHRSLLAGALARGGGVDLPRDAAHRPDRGPRRPTRAHALPRPPAAVTRRRRPARPR